MTSLNQQFILRFLSIVLIDLTLSGDNAVVIAAAVKSLPVGLRKRALIGGGAGAVLALVLATAFAGRLLRVEFLRLIGGLAILWIAFGLFRAEPDPGQPESNATGFWKAMWFVVLADVTMSTDNILAVAAVAQGDIVLLLFGLTISIPLVLFASGLLADLMNKYPLILYVGAALLGRVAGQMITSDVFIVRRFAPNAGVQIWSEITGAALVLVVGWQLRRRSRRRAA